MTRDFTHVPLPAGATKIVSMTQFQGVLYVATDVGICRLVDNILVPVPFAATSPASELSDKNVVRLFPDKPDKS